jgi:hypothetical protein
MHTVQRNHIHVFKGEDMNIVEYTPAAKAVEPKAPKFFHFSQNNPGGSFDINETVAHHVIIEAYDALDANTRAMEIGIYFNGCDTGADCSCCGDRWSEQWREDNGDDTPLIYGDPPETYEDYFTKEGQPVCHIYRLDGSKATYRKQAKEKTE